MEELTRLVERAAGGEEQAFHELYRRCRPSVVRAASAFAQLDGDEVEDVVQESFVRAFKALPRLRAQGAFEPWLLSIARNRALTQLARKTQQHKVRNELEHEPEPESLTAIPKSLQLEREAGLVREMIERLPDGPEKETVRLFYVEGELSAREIADRLGVGKSAITMRLERFRARVKRELLRRVVASRME